jgi:hypothetical protein
MRMRSGVYYWSTGEIKPIIYKRKGETADDLSHQLHDITRAT